jgi:hypothetical protein
VQLIDEPAVQFIAAGPAKQRRLTVAFRLILAIPHLLALFFLNIGGFVVAFLGWWGALFMGRLPEFAVGYLSGLARWNARVYGYVYLLTDVYPPFTLDEDPSYPVVIAIPEPGRLNRLAVFFRFILIIWAELVITVVGGGTGIMAIVAWLITLVAGRLPAPLHQAFTAVLRYQTRYYCYLSLLTSTYPAGLFGDQPDASAPVQTAPAAPAAPAESTESAWGTPSGYGTPPAYDTTPANESTPGYGTPQSVYGAPGEYGGAQSVATAANWRLVLTRSAKILLIVCTVLGLANVGSEIFSFSSRIQNANSVTTQADAVSAWNSANTTLNTKMTAWSTAEQGCNDITCATTASTQGAAIMSAFASEVQAISMPSDATSAVAKVVADATKAAAAFTTLSHATSAAQYQSEATSTGIEQDLTALHTDTNTAATALDNSAP